MRPVSSKTAAAALAALAALALSACDPVGTANPVATGTGGTGAVASATPGVGGGTGRDACLLGTWQVDVDDLAEQTAAKVGRGATGSGTGTITLTFADRMTIDYRSTVSIKAPIGDLTMIMKNSLTGASTSTDWSAKDGRLAGTMPADAVVSKIVTTINGKETPTTTTPLSGALDMSAGNLGYTCAGSTATFTTPLVTWHLAKA